MGPNKVAMLSIFIIVLLALSIDWLLGEPKRWHPLVGFGYLVKRVESRLYGSSTNTNTQQLFRGTAAVVILLVPSIVISYYLANIPVFGTVFTLIALSLAIGHKSLHQHAQPIADALIAGDQTHARLLTSRIVSRDPATLNIPRATIESVLENGADSIFCAIFWFVIGGAPAVIVYRLANTLDAMWGYRNQRYLYFGRFAARLDDVLNYIPARLSALSYAFLGNTKQAFQAWKNQTKQCESPNAGPVMASGAGALNLTLGGPAQYGGQWLQRPLLGYGLEPTANDIYRALRLVRHSVLLWLICLFIIVVASYA